MIAPLRKRHRVSAAVLAILLPGLTFAALRARSEVPASNALVDTVERVRVARDAGARTVDVDWEGADVATRLFAEGAVLELTAREDPRKPDVLVYWRPLEREVRFLLGSLAGTQPRLYALPDEARVTPGTLELMSLAHGETFARAALPATGE